MTVRYAKRAADPALSVVIPSIPANDHGRTVAHLHEQTLREPYEVIVVSDASINRSVARNRGLAKAAANIVALTDDDTAPPPEWLTTIYSEFMDDPELVCLEGPVYGGCRNHAPRHYVGCNLAVCREEALAVGGFRSEFSEWREDVEFGWRMERDADGNCRYCPEMRMCHPSVPRTSFKLDLERRLRAEYPECYATVMNATFGRRVYRWARARGITQLAHRILNSVGYHREPLV